MKDNEQQGKQDSGLPSRPLICSACVEMREGFPVHNFCFDCVKLQPDNKLSWQEKWLRHLDNCETQRRGIGCSCVDGKFLFSRVSDEKLRIEMGKLGIEIPNTVHRGN